MRLDFCVACGRRDNLDNHHLVPKSVGGGDEDTNLITLCRECHGRVHGVGWSNEHAATTKAGMERARAAGARIGRPSLPRETAVQIAKLAKQGITTYRIAKDLGISYKTAVKYVP